LEKKIQANEQKLFSRCAFFHVYGFGTRATFKYNGRIVY